MTNTEKDEQPIVTPDEPDGVERPQAPGDHRMRADRDRYPDVEDQPEMPISIEGHRGTRQIHPGATVDNDEQPEE